MTWRKPMRIFGDPPQDRDYLAVGGPDGSILLIPADGDPTASGEDVAPMVPAQPRPRTERERDAQLAEHLKAVAPLLRSTSAWVKSATPYTDLKKDCEQLMTQAPVAAGVRQHLTTQHAVRSAADMLVAAISMSARADWRATPPEGRGTAARGWFLGRWIPTFLVVDGPITRFLKSSAFRAQDPRAETFRDARRLLCDEPAFTAVRNAFAHWSFGWQVVGRDSEIVIYDERAGIETMRLSRRQCDALHMIAFATVDILNQTMLQRGWIRP